MIQAKQINIKLIDIFQLKLELLFLLFGLFLPDKFGFRS
jgi:hypothetical protein